MSAVVRIAAFEGYGAPCDVRSYPSADPAADLARLHTTMQLVRAIEAGAVVGADEFYLRIVGQRPGRWSYYWVGRLIVKRWRARLARTGDEAEVRLRMRKQGISGVLARMILRGWA